jgi:hypothetical protein
MSISFSLRVRPSPEQALQGFSMMRPSPWHARHGCTLTNWPKTDRCTMRSSPDP